MEKTMELKPGDLENVAGGFRADDLVTGERYTVKEGDTIKSIADFHGTTVLALASLNIKTLMDEAEKKGLHFDDITEYANHIFPGMVLRLPTGR